MKQMRLGTSELQVSQIALGCARLTQLDQKGAAQLLHTALEEGINFFDHADIYDGGACESLFSKALELTPSLREKLVLQTKCGICPGYFDSSREHILESVDNSLKRLNTEYVDVLLLHRPDTLMEPEEVARAFESLRDSGKVRYFGVSNQTPGTMELLSQALTVPLVADQLQFSPCTPICRSTPRWIGTAAFWNTAAAGISLSRPGPPSSMEPGTGFIWGMKKNGGNSTGCCGSYPSRREFLLRRW